jgi:hypothetical protein
MTSRLRAPASSPDWSKYDKLVAEAMLAFQQDVMYAVLVVESARSISEKKSTAMRKSKSKTLRG